MKIVAIAFGFGGGLIAETTEQSRHSLEFPGIDEDVEVDHPSPCGMIGLVLEDPSRAFQRGQAQIGGRAELQKRAADPGVALPILPVGLRQNRPPEFR